MAAGVDDLLEQLRHFRDSDVRDRLLGLVGLALILLAIVQELRKPSAARSGQGEVLGFVPYDLRPPTLSRLRASVWQPESERWLLPRSLGLGWSPNVARLAAVLRNRSRR
jgi:hypothetical protein